LRDLWGGGNLTDAIQDAYGDVEPQLDQAAELQKEWHTELGQIWEIGKHRLMCGDATKKEDVEKFMTEEKAEMLFTDPPYLMNFKGSPPRDGYQPSNAKHKDIINDKLDRGAAGIFLSRIALIIKGYVVGSYYIFFYHLGIEKILNALLLNGLNYKSVIIWQKNNLNLSNSDYKSIYEPIIYGWNETHNFYGRKGAVDVITMKRSPDGESPIGLQGRSTYLKVGKYYYKFEKLEIEPKHFIEIKDHQRVIFNLFSGEHDIWEIDKIKKNDLHPTTKPVDLAKKAIRNSSKENEIILDPFLGSGSTMIAAEQLNRICYGMEIEPKYVAVTLQRMRDAFPDIEIKRIE
jgi:DNA modification methylase